MYLLLLNLNLGLLVLDDNDFSVVRWYINFL
jgi:hypothetical protein